jgi:hypothetical protein
MEIKEEKADERRRWNRKKDRGSGKKMNNTRRELGQVYKFLKYIYYSRTDAGRRC